MQSPHEPLPCPTSPRMSTFLLAARPPRSDHDKNIKRFSQRAPSASFRSRSPLSFTFCLRSVGRRSANKREIAQKPCWSGRRKNSKKAKEKKMKRGHKRQSNLRPMNVAHCCGKQRWRRFAFCFLCIAIALRTDRHVWPRPHCSHSLSLAVPTLCRCYARSSVVVQSMPLLMMFD